MSAALFFLSSSAAWGSTYYVSKSQGSDSNTSAQAQSKATAWAHVPGMASCTANCSSYTPKAGDTFVLMGCDVWTAASDLPLNFNWSGSSGSLITIGGEDETWYNTTNCPTAWSRPVFSNASNAVLSSACGTNAYVTAGCSNSLTYVAFDNIEMTGLYCSGSCDGTQDYFHTPACQYCRFTNLYLHGLNIATDGNCTIFKSYETNAVLGSIWQYNIVSGSDRVNPAAPNSACDVFYGFYEGGTIDGNVIHDVVNPFVVVANGQLIISRNLVYNILSSNGDNHCNLLETDGGSGPFVIYNNVFAWSLPDGGSTCAGGEMMWLANTTNEVDYVWNNVIFNMNNGQTVQVGNSNGPYSVYFWNNTVATSAAGSSASAACLQLGSGRTATFNALVVQNNHCITEGANMYSGITPTTASNNVVQTHAVANANSSPHFDRYTALAPYVYSPVAATNSTVGVGANLTTASWLPSGFSTSGLSSTIYACWLMNLNAVLQANCPGRSSIARPASGAWDAGAYQSNGSFPNSPSNLTIP